MRRRLAVLLAAVALVAWPAAQAPAHTAPVKAVAAHSCSSGYKHAVIGGSHKCLRRGQYCAKAYRSTYRRYGYVCGADSRGVYRLR
jgi:hypothetical protein